MNRLSLLIIFLSCSLLSFSADKLKGYVYSPDNKPLIGAHVKWENEKQGVVTNEDGYFEITGDSKKHHMLVVSYFGYEPQTIHLHNYDDVHKITLRDNALSEVVITKSVAGRISSSTELLKTEKITTKELSRAACCNLSESFETNPSVDVVYSDAVTGARQIQMLGLSGSYVQMLTENYPNFRGAAKLYGLDYIPGSWMEGIQIAKGASAVKNGYESITGQINVDYKKPNTADPLSLNLFLDQAGRVEGNADGAILLNDKLSTGLFLHYSTEQSEHDKNNDSFLDAPKKQQFNIMNRWHYATDKFISQSGIKFLNDDRTSGQTNKTLPAGVNYDPYVINSKSNRAEFFTKNGYITNHDKNQSLALILSGSYHDQKSHYASAKYNVYQTNLYSSLMFENEFSSAHKISTGLSYNYDNYNQSIAIPQLQPTKQPDLESVYGAYAQYTYTLKDKLTVLAGLRADKSSLHDWFITPRIHIKYDIVHGVHLRMSAGKGYRSVFVLPEYSYMLASSRTIDIANNLKQEAGWNYGLSGSFHIPIKNELLVLTAEWYYTNFDRQVVMDMDSDPHKISFYNLNGKSNSNVFQVEATYPLFRGFNLLAAYRWMDTKVNYNGVVKQKPLQSRYKALVTASYETPLRKWQFDYTLQMNGSGRMPTPDTSNPLWNNDFGAYTVMNAQVTKFFKNWSVYLGGENLLDKTQHNPVIAANDPYGSNFDANMVWGPTMGRKIYLGLRFNLSRN